MSVLGDIPTLTISEFGRQSGLSHKALRLYDMSGLLSPAEIVPHSGYRLYHVDQLERARRISMLRQLDMPLATVSKVLDGTDEETAYQLELWWSQQEATMRSKRATLVYLRGRLARLSSGSPSVYPVSTRALPATKIATVTREVDQRELVSTMLQTEEEIRAYLRGAGATVTQERWALFHGFVTPDSEAPVEICVPFEGTVDPWGDIAIRIEAAHTQAFCAVPRDECYFPQILIAYDNVRDWITRSDLVRVGSPREMYFACWDDVAGTDPFVYVAQPYTEDPTDE